MVEKVCFLSFILLLAGVLHSQTTQTDSIGKVEAIKQDQVKQKGRFKTNWKLPYPNPLRAGVYSLVLPGSGQIYNKKYWKVPIVWGGFGALVYSVDYNKRWRDRFKTAYGLSVRGKPHEFSEVITSSETLRRLRNNYDKNLQLSYIGFFGLYALTALDSYVDAHLKAFDISDDLSIYVYPELIASSGNSNAGLGIALRF